MEKYYLCITNERNWEIAVTKHVWGVTNKHIRELERLRIGDFLVFYLKPSKIGGVFEVTSQMFNEDEPLFVSEGFDKKEIFSNRIRIKPFKIPGSPVEFKPLIPMLRFIKRKDRSWGASIQGKALVAIFKEDFECILNAIVKG